MMNEFLAKRTALRIPHKSASVTVVNLYCFLCIDRHLVWRKMLSRGALPSTFCDLTPEFRSKIAKSTQLRNSGIVVNSHNSGNSGAFSGRSTVTEALERINNTCLKKHRFLNGSRLRFRCSYTLQPFYLKDPLHDRIFLPHGVGYIAELSCHELQCLQNEFECPNLVNISHN